MSLAVALLSTGVVTANSLTSLTAMVKVWLAVEPSADLAWTVTFREAPSASRSMAAATVTTPVLAAMAQRRTAVSVREQVTALFGVLLCLARAVRPTTVFFF